MRGVVARATLVQRDGVAVALDALFGPDLVVNNASGMTTVPSAVIVVVFAYLATRVVARDGFRRSGDK